LESIKIGNTVVEYNIIKSKRKTVGIIVEPEKGVIVRSPERLSEEKIKRLIQKKSSWILEKLDRVSEVKPGPSPKEFLSGEKLPYLGRRYRLKVKEKEDIEKARIKLYRGHFYIYYPATITDEREGREAIRNELIKWYRRQADKKLRKRVDKYKKRIGVEPNSIRIKKQEKRWGSCSSKGNINFNWKIIIAPMIVVDYIVAHELVHLKHPNHSREFWELVETIIPDYEERQEWLRINGRRLTLS